jgi:spore maturation protein A
VRYLVNIIWLILIAGGFLAAVFTGRLEQTVQAAFDSAKYAVELGFALIGIYSLWLGIMRVAEKSGLVKAVSGRMAPLLKILFPDVPVRSPAMGAMSMNIIANMLGLGNAATPLGISAMKELQKVNRNKGAPSDAMCLFTVLNTASVQLIPTTVIALRSAAGSTGPAEIIGTTLAATICSAAAGITAALILKRFYQ